MTPNRRLTSIEAVVSAFAEVGYIADRGTATAVFLSLELGKPLFLEGEPGVGKTEIAKVLATIEETELIRLQCYEGLDLAAAAYEWNYTRQLLELRATESRRSDGDGAATRGLFTDEFLLERPLLRAIRASSEGASVLLIDELDRADEEFEAFLLEFLAEAQLTIPELGTVRAAHPPIVVITSNRTREIHDALKRRCLYHWIDFPSFDKELEILARRVPGASDTLAREVVGFVQALRSEDLFKRPGIAESIDWIQALIALDQERLTDAVLRETLGVLLKYQDDLERVDSAAARRLLERAQAANVP